LLTYITQPQKRWHQSRNHFECWLVGLPWKFFIYEGNEVHSQHRNWRNNFFSHKSVRCSLPPWVPVLSASSNQLPWQHKVVP